MQKQLKYFTFFVLGKLYREIFKKCKIFIYTESTVAEKDAVVMHLGSYLQWLRSQTWRDWRESLGILEACLVYPLHLWQHLCTLHSEFHWQFSWRGRPVCLKRNAFSIKCVSCHCFYIANKFLIMNRYLSWFYKYLYQGVYFTGCKIWHLSYKNIGFCLVCCLHLSRCFFLQYFTSQSTIFQSYMWQHIDVQAGWRRLDQMLGSITVNV